MEQIHDDLGAAIASIESELSEMEEDEKTNAEKKLTEIFSLAKNGVQMFDTNVSTTMDESKVSNVKLHEMKEMMDEIDNDIKEQQQSTKGKNEQISQQLNSETTRLIDQAFQDLDHNDIEQLKMQYWSDFTQHDSNNCQDLIKKDSCFVDKWKDYVNFRFNFIENELKPLLLQLNSKNEMLINDKILDSFKLSKNNFGEWYLSIEDIRLCRGHENKCIQSISIYYIMYQCIFNMILDNISIFSIDNIDDIVNYIKDRILTVFSQTDMFDGLTESVKGNVFDNSLDELIGVIKDCCNNTINIKAYNNTRNGEKLFLNMVGCRFSLFMFKRLLDHAGMVPIAGGDNGSKWNKIGNNDGKTNLLKMFCLFYQLSVYNACLEDNSEALALETYFYLQSFPFAGVVLSQSFNENTGGVKSDNKQHAHLRNFNFFKRGTLLHFATQQHYYQFCQVLISDGFDPNTKLNDTQQQQSSVDIAKSKNFNSIITLFASVEFLFVLHMCGPVVQVVLNIEKNVFLFLYCFVLQHIRQRKNQRQKQQKMQFKKNIFHFENKQHFVMILFEHYMKDQKMVKK